MPIFKSFNSRFNSERRRAMACYDEIDLANNIDGESVEYAAKRLWARREARKLMIVLSDGLPCAEGDRSAQDWHLAETVKRIQSGGIEVFGIGIMSAAVKRYYRNHVVINKLDELPTTVMRQLEVMLLDSTKAA